MEISNNDISNPHINHKIILNLWNWVMSIFLSLIKESLITPLRLNRLIYVTNVKLHFNKKDL